jgi:hypothetical protein
MAEEFIEAEEELATTEQEREDIEEAIDLNARLLEVMVERTEILEKLLSGAADIETIKHELEMVKMPSLEKRRRRKKA